MRKATKIKGTVCSKCGASDNIVGYGFNRSGSQRCRCNHCGKIYTLNPKTHEYPEEVKEQAIKVFYSGESGRSVGKIFGMSKANVYRWLKKTESSVDKSDN